MVETLIEELCARAQGPERATDRHMSGDEWRGAVAQPPASAESIAVAERRLGFPLPDLLRLVYERVGNGGFGPGDGLLGLPTGDDLRAGETIVSTYERQRAVIAHDGKAAIADDDALVMDWPWGLLPFCSWGSGIYSCVDCTGLQASIVRFDPHQFWAEGESAEECYQNVLLPESPTLVDWLGAWLAGEDLFATPDNGRWPKVSRRRGPRRATVLGIAVCCLFGVLVVVRPRLFQPELEFHIRAVPCSAASAASMQLTQQIESGRVAQVSNYSGQALSVRTSVDGCNLRLTIAGTSDARPFAMLGEHGSLVVYGMGSLPHPMSGDTFAPVHAPLCAPTHAQAPCVVFRGDDLDPSSIVITYNQWGAPQVNFGVGGSAADRLAQYTGTHIGSAMPVVLDGEVITSPTIQEALPGIGVIILVTIGEAEAIKAKLTAGTLPFPVTIVSVSERMGVPLLGR